MQLPALLQEYPFHVAQKSKTNLLILTHFSSRYSEMKTLEKEARKIHRNTVAGDDLMNFLLESEGIAGVHGAAFGLSPYFRLSYATDEKTLIDACERIRRACSNLR